MPISAMQQSHKEWRQACSRRNKTWNTGYILRCMRSIIYIRLWFFAQQKSYEDGYMEGYKKGYSEGFNQGYNKDFNQIALIAGAACVGAAIGAASIMYCTKCRQQDTHIANAQINQVISNNLALVE